MVIFILLWRRVFVIIICIRCPRCILFHLLHLVNRLIWTIGPWWFSMLNFGLGWFLGNCSWWWNPSRWRRLSDSFRTIWLLIGRQLIWLWILLIFMTCLTRINVTSIAPIECFFRTSLVCDLEPTPITQMKWSYWTFLDSHLMRAWLLSSSFIWNILTVSLRREIWFSLSRYWWFPLQVWLQLHIRFGVQWWRLLHRWNLNVWLQFLHLWLTFFAGLLVLLWIRIFLFLRRRILIFVILILFWRRWWFFSNLHIINRWRISLALLLSSWVSGRIFDDDALLLLDDFWWTNSWCVLSESCI